jgi:hypothetical protein
MISRWLQRLRGDSGSATTNEPGEPATAPEPPSLPAEPSTDADASAEDPTGDEPA